MARVGRLEGAILAETQGAYYLVGYTKAPCDWERVGFVRPSELPGLEQPYMRLSGALVGEFEGAHLTMQLEGEDLARSLSRLFLVARNGSVSERLWRMVVNPEGDLDLPAAGAIDATWLERTPPQIWQIVRDAVLRCV